MLHSTVNVLDAPKASFQMAEVVNYITYILA